ncbi:hypothetical protein AVEN_37601-1 [Araneus ventricosus]|uniref:Uncharacterized protein n=1 Tax=Araneus ventricosus TaxID=182803 RepID=A0A4Y2I6I1_ARAVE|nr:hypothetical protein AVEN_37601-1 [Araneus ventricosus]
MPRQFYSGNMDCRVIVDCTEFPIQKPNSPANGLQFLQKHKYVKRENYENCWKWLLNETIKNELMTTFSDIK